MYPGNQGTHDKLNQIQEIIETPLKFWSSLSYEPWQLCTLLQYIERHVYPGNKGTHDQGTQDKLYQIRKVIGTPSKFWLSLSCEPWFPATVYLFVNISNVMCTLETREHMANLTRYGKSFDFWGSFNNFPDLVKFVMCTLVFRVHMTFDILIKGYKGTHDKLTRTLRVFQ